MKCPLAGQVTRIAAPFLFGLAMTMSGAHAATTVPFTFSAGATAHASDVNADFQALATAMDNLNTALSAVESSVTAITGSNTTFAGNDTFSGNVSVAGTASVGALAAGSVNTTGTLTAGLSSLRIANSASAPATATTLNMGQLYFDTTTNELMFSNGSQWRNASNTDNYGFTSDTTRETLSSGVLTSRRFVFNKLSANSKIRITYSDALLLTASSGGPASATWQIEVDGNPEPIQASLYTGTSQTATDAATVVGYVSGLAQGAHTVTVDVTSTGSPTAVIAGWSAGSTATLEALEVN